MRLKVTVDARLRLEKRAVKDAGLTLREVREIFEYDNPDFWKKQRMGYWTGDTPRKIGLVESNETELLLPRGG